MEVRKAAYSRRVKSLLKRDGHCCWLCGKRFLMGAHPNHPDAPSIDHVIEKRNGGWNSRDNLRLAHRRCNAARQHYFPHTNMDNAVVRDPALVMA
jgi:5-methylcytosine-specific restriction endonuclease McrA